MTVPLTSHVNGAMGSAEPGSVHDPIVLIPAYKPSTSLLAAIAELAASPVVRAVVIVNDGSGPEFTSLFANLAKIDGVQVLAHVVNLGKGAALKTGLNYTACTYPESVGVVTADADGQHTVKDILRVAEALTSRPQHLVLGTRSFDGEVPFRSWLGNRLTRHVLRATTGQRISDTQTGLRGIPMAFISSLVRLRPNGYDFELDMLLACKYSMRRISEIPIETVYLNGNCSSHFNPLRDSMRIYFVLLRFAAVSLSTAVIDNLVFLAAFHSFPYVLASQVSGRLVAGLFNYYTNKRNVFHADVPDKFALPKYWLSVASFGAASYVLINAFLSLGIKVPAAKICAETILFGFSFVVQRDFVFSRRTSLESLTE